MMASPAGRARDLNLGSSSRMFPRSSRFCRYVDLWCVRLRGRHLYVEGNLLSQGKLPYHSSKISIVKGPKVVVGASDREYVLEGKMVPRKTAFPDTFPQCRVDATVHL